MPADALVTYEAAGQNILFPAPEELKFKIAGH